MSALAHLLETRGLPTVAIALIRLHAEKVRPPRALAVPFQLGRPFGQPGDAAFQTRVLAAALRLLEREDGPVVLEDFAEPAPNETDTPGWSAPLDLPAPAPQAGLDPGAWSVALAAEIAAVQPHWRRAGRRFGRTTIGIGGHAPEAWPALMARFLAAPVPDSPTPGLAPALAVRFMADDLKAFYSEAAQSAGPAPSSRQIDDWFWGSTIAARFLVALRAAALASDHTAFKTVGGRFFVPGPRVPAA